MKIDMHNYESYLLDYQDGKLSQDEIEQLRDFVLSQGMDWDALSEELPQLEVPEMHFDGKEALLQSEIAPLGPVNKNNYESYFVAYHEGLLGEEEQRQVLCFIRINDSLSDDFKLFGLSWLKPDTNEVFQGKESLKKVGSFRCFAKLLLLPPPWCCFLSHFGDETNLCLCRKWLPN